MNKLILGIQVLLVLGFCALGYELLNIKAQIANDKQISNVKTQSSNLDTTENSAKLPTSASDINSQISELKNYVDQKDAELQKNIDNKQCNCSSTTTQVVTQTSQKQTSYISMGDTYVVTSTDWVDVPGSDVYVDLVNDYSESAYVDWAADLKVAHGNGQAFARLYDATNNIAVVGSELTTVNNATFQHVGSPQLALWRGRNLYKVQVKSLNSFEVTYSGGKLKIVY